MVLYELFLVLSLITISELKNNFLYNPTFEPEDYLGPKIYKEENVKYWSSKPSHSFFISTWHDERYLAMEESTLLKLFMNQVNTYKEIFYLSKGRYSFFVTVAQKDMKTIVLIPISICNFKGRIEINTFDSFPKEKKILTFTLLKTTNCLINIKEHNIERNEEIKSSILLSNLKLYRIKKRLFPFCTSECED